MKVILDMHNAMFYNKGTINRKKYRCIGTDICGNRIYALRSDINDAVSSSALFFAGDASKSFSVGAHVIEELKTGSVVIYADVSCSFCTTRDKILFEHYSNLGVLDCTEMFERSTSSEHFVHLICTALGKRATVRYRHLKHPRNLSAYYENIKHFDSYLITYFYTRTK